jgi:pyruvate dehydrogenase E1 component alpha subunit
LLLECSHAVERAAEEYLTTPPEAVSTIFDHVYATRPADLSAQREIALTPSRSA